MNDPAYSTNGSPKIWIAQLVEISIKRSRKIREYNFEIFEERPILAKYKEGDKKNSGFWFIVPSFWLKEKNKKQQTRDQKPNLYSNRAKGGLSKGLTLK